jgi:ABC-type antimicrobial peptide transport system permease subunit
VQVGIGNFSMYTSMAYLPTSAAEPGTSLTLRVRGESEQARQQLSERLAELDPGIGNIWTLAGSASRGVSILRAGFWMTASLGALALLLTTSGVFGVISYLVEQRRREIGVRMALGARAGNVLRLVLFQSLRPVAVGLAVGGALAGTLATALLALPAAMRTGEVVRVYDPLSYSASILCIAIFCVLAALVPAWRAARINPLSALRSE